jgi:hypothetical protein
MRSVSIAHDGHVRKTERWHSDLLASVATATPSRPALLSEPTAARLYDYLTYRHRFRNLYSDALDWALMRPLVMDMERTLAAFEADLGLFLTSNKQP